MKTAIVVDACTVLGKAYIRHLKAYFPEVERLWLIARQRYQLESLAAELEDTLSVCILPLDLCDGSSMTAIQSILKAEGPDVVLLINCSNNGFLVNTVEEGNLYALTQMTVVQVTSLTAVTNLVLPYMSEGGRILFVSSAAAFCPIPRMTVYSAVQRYVYDFSRCLNVELKSRNISVTAVCPGPVETDSIAVKETVNQSRLLRKLPHSSAEILALKSIQAAKRRKSLYTPYMLYKIFYFAAKILPYSLMVKFLKL